MGREHLAIIIRDKVSCGDLKNAVALTKSDTEESTDCVHFYRYFGWEAASAKVRLASRRKLDDRQAALLARGKSDLNVRTV
jgi:hypothetical protein